jgi:hypothetical protein
MTDGNLAYFAYGRDEEDVRKTEMITHSSPAWLSLMDYEMLVALS